MARKKQQQPSKKGGKTYWMYGTHTCVAALDNSNRTVRRVLATTNAAGRLSHSNIEIVESRQIESVLPHDAVHQGIAVEVERLDPPALDDIIREKQTVIMLDQVTDPHNVGAVLRSAAAFGVAGVVSPKDHAPSESGVLAKSACGALDMVPLMTVTNLVKALQELKNNGYWIAGLDGEAKAPISDVAKLKPLCLVMGAEGKGLRRLTREHCDTVLYIPMDTRMESLNVSNAAAIALYEAFKE